MTALAELTATEREARALLSSLVEPGDGDVGWLVQTYGLNMALLRIFRTDVAYPLMHNEQDRMETIRKRLLPRLNLRQPPMAETLAGYERMGITTLIPGDPDWPIGLDDLGVHAPHILYVRGSTYTVGQLDRVKSVAIVGARAATSYGEHVAREMGSELAQRAVPVVSGAAYGIDGAVHSAVVAAGGMTVAFLAGGADRAYPQGHSELLNRIVQTGAVVSEVPPGSTPTKWRFLQRNRLIAAATEATVVVEAGFRSGSLNTAGHAQGLGRALGAVPGPVTSVASAGCHRLLREFGATCITGTDDVMQLLGYTG